MWITVEELKNNLTSNHDLNSTHIAQTQQTILPVNEIWVSTAILYPVVITRSSMTHNKLKVLNIVNTVTSQPIYHKRKKMSYKLWDNSQRCQKILENLTTPSGM